MDRQGLVEGTDWRWGTTAEWAGPAVVDTGPEVAIDGDGIEPDEPWLLPIMICASGVRRIGGRQTADMMQSGVLPAEMPFAVWPRTDAPSPN